jgi:hypothetical protein
MKSPFPFKISEDTVAEFIARNFDINKAVLATGDRVEKFRSLARQDKEEIAAAKEYQDLTGASAEECRLATAFARSLKPLS